MISLILVRWVHLMAAVTWIGGMLFMTLVLGPRLVQAVGNPVSSPLRGRVVWLARVNLAVGLLVFLAAVRLSHV